MNTSLNTSIEPQFLTIDGLRIRCCDSGGSREPTLLLTSPGPPCCTNGQPPFGPLSMAAISCPSGVSRLSSEKMSPPRRVARPGSAWL